MCDSGNYPKYCDLMPDRNIQWLSNPSFQYEDMTGLLDLANKAQEKIFPNFEENTQFKIDPEDVLNFDGIDWQAVFTDNSSPIIYVAAMIIISFFIFLGALLFCCCSKCLCCCWDAEKEIKYKFRKNKKLTGSKLYFGIFLATSMTVLILFFMTFLICGFVITGQLHQGISDTAPDIDNSFVDTQMYLNLTKQEIKATLVDAFEITEKDVLTLIENFPEEAKATVKNSMKATKTNLNDVYVTLKDAIDDVRIDSARKSVDDSKEILEVFNDATFALGIFQGVIFVIPGILIFLGTIASFLGGLLENEKYLKVGYIMSRNGIVIALSVFLFTTIWYTLQFSLSGILTQIICKAVRNLENYEPPVEPEPVFLKAMQIGQYDPPNYGWIISRSKAGDSAYEVLQLEQVYNFDEVEQIIEGLKNYLCPNNRCEIPGADQLITTLNGYLEFSQDNIKTYVGSSKPLYDAADATLNTICYKTGGPVQGNWLSSNFIHFIILLIAINLYFLEICLY